MSSVVFSYQQAREREYLDQLLKEKKWFELNKFGIFLPNSIGKAAVSSREVTWLRKEWRKIEKDYLSIVGEFRHKKFSPRYECHVSRFGPEGKYTCPDTLFVRLRTKRDKETVIETVGHELLHLVFADFFESEKLKYAEREGIIDALILKSDLFKLFPQYEKQSIGKVRRKILEDILRTTP